MLSSLCVKSSLNRSWEVLISKKSSSDTYSNVMGRYCVHDKCYLLWLGIGYVMKTFVKSATRPSYTHLLPVCASDSLPMLAALIFQVWATKGRVKPSCESRKAQQVCEPMKESLFGHVTNFMVYNFMFNLAKDLKREIRSLSVATIPEHDAGQGFSWLLT